MVFAVALALRFVFVTQFWSTLSDWQGDPESAGEVQALIDSLDAE